MPDVKVLKAPIQSIEPVSKAQLFKNVMFVYMCFHTDTYMHALQYIEAISLLYTHCNM